MPKGKYQRKKGRTPEVRAKVARILKENATSLEWRGKVSVATKQAMHSPKVREKHLAGWAKAKEKYGTNFRGGNGQEMTPIVRLASELLSRCGYIREYPIPTRLVKDKFENVATAYKVDFGHPTDKIAIELDGAIHRG